MLKYIWRDKKQLIIIIGVILVCSIAIAIGIYAQITNTKINKTAEEKREAPGAVTSRVYASCTKARGKDCKNSLMRRERGNDTIIFKIGNKTAQGKGCWAATGKGERQNGGQSA